MNLKIIKIGGNIINDDLALQKFITDFANLKVQKFWFMVVAIQHLIYLNN